MSLVLVGCPFRRPVDREERNKRDRVDRHHGGPAPGQTTLLGQLRQYISYNPLPFWTQPRGLLRRYKKLKLEKKLLFIFRRLGLCI